MQSLSDQRNLLSAACGHCTLSFCVDLPRRVFRVFGYEIDRRRIDGSCGYSSRILDCHRSFLCHFDCFDLAHRYQKVSLRARCGTQSWTFVNFLCSLRLRNYARKHHLFCSDFFSAFPLALRPSQGMGSRNCVFLPCHCGVY